MNDAMSPLDLVGLIVVALALVKILGPIGQAIGQKLKGSDRSSDSALLAAVDGLKQRLAEVEERLDFSERLLTSNRQGDQLPGRFQQ